jgi:phosphoglycolate phosphatase-like HAD superfamily hydrolase
VTDTLASWNDGAARTAILAFVEGASTEGDSYIEPADRIAVFDNDCTMWIDQPLPVQLDFIVRALAQAAQDDKSLADKEPYKAILTKDPTFFAAVGQQQPDAIEALDAALARTWLGDTPDKFEAQVAAYLAEAKSEKLGVLYTDLVYKPMLELFALLEAHDFRVFVCSGGGREFMRVTAESAWNIPRERVIGSAPSYKYEDGVIKRGGEMLGGLALGPGKPEHIFATAGRLPAFAGGNADVDIEMLESAAFAMLVVHDDDDREFAYTAAAERSVAAAKKNGWTLVSVKDDWNTVF